MYIFANKSRMIIGIFSTKEMLDVAIAVAKHDDPYAKFYYMEFTPDVFNYDLAIFWTMHPKKMIEVK